MKKFLYVLLVLVVLLVGVAAGWIVSDVMSAQNVTPRDGTGIRVTAVLDEIDYTAFADLLTERIGAEKVADVLNTAGKALLDFLPQETKDKLVVYLINENREELNQLLTETLAEHGLSVKVDLTAENLGEE